MRTTTVVAVALLFALTSCATGNLEPGESRRRVKCSDLPASLRKVLRVREQDSMTFDGSPHAWSWVPLDESGEQLMVDGLPVMEECFIQWWSISLGQNGATHRNGGGLVLGGSDGNWHIKGAVVHALPFGNWRTIWAGVAPMPAAIMH